MSLLSPEAQDFHDRLLKRYVSQLNQTGIENVTEYFDRLGAFDEGPIEDSAEVRELLTTEEFPLEIFYRR